MIGKNRYKPLQTYAKAINPWKSAIKRIFALFLGMFLTLFIEKMLPTDVCSTIELRWWHLGTLNYFGGCCAQQYRHARSIMRGLELPKWPHRISQGRSKMQLKSSFLHFLGYLWHILSKKRSLRVYNHRSSIDDGNGRTSMSSRNVFHKH